MGKTATMTASEFHAWYLHQDKRYELLGGIPEMSPAPHPHHQHAAGLLARLIGNFLDGKDIGMLFQEIDWWVSGRSYVRPDLLLIPMEQAEEMLRNTSQDYTKDLQPILCVEVLSPSSRKRDLVEKKALYEEAGVEEYWVVDARASSFRIFTRRQKRSPFSETVLASGIYDTCKVLPGLSLDLDHLWQRLSPGSPR